jgi:hypothetical protein
MGRQIVSVYSSICQDHEDQFDVAYSMLGNDIRIIIWKDEDSGTQAQMNLTDTETEHLIEVLKIALERSKR